MRAPPSGKLTRAQCEALFPNVEQPARMTDNPDQHFAWAARMAVFDRDPAWRQHMRTCTIKAMGTERPLPIAMRRWLMFLLLEHDELPHRAGRGRRPDPKGAYERRAALAHWWARDERANPKRSKTLRMMDAYAAHAKCGWSESSMRKTIESRMFGHALDAERELLAILPKNKK